MRATISQTALTLTLAVSFVAGIGAVTVGCGSSSQPTYTYHSERGLRCYTGCKSSTRNCRSRCRRTWDRDYDPKCVKECTEKEEPCLERCPDVRRQE